MGLLDHAGRNFTAGKVDFSGSAAPAAITIDWPLQSVLPSETAEPAPASSALGPCALPVLHASNVVKPRAAADLQQVPHTDTQNGGVRSDPLKSSNAGTVAVAASIPTVEKRTTPAVSYAPSPTFNAAAAPALEGPPGVSPSAMSDPHHSSTASSHTTPMVSSVGVTARAQAVSPAAPPAASPALRMKSAVSPAMALGLPLELHDDGCDDLPDLCLDSPSGDEHGAAILP